MFKCILYSQGLIFGIQREPQMIPRFDWESWLKASIACLSQNKSQGFVKQGSGFSSCFPLTSSSLTLICFYSFASNGIQSA